jgi:hypothetical protein
MIALQSVSVGLLASDLPSIFAIRRELSGVSHISLAGLLSNDTVPYRTKDTLLYRFKNAENERINVMKIAKPKAGHAPVKIVFDSSRQ